MSGFNSYTYELDLSVWRELFLSKGSPMRFRKGEIFVRHGKRLRYCGFVLSGTFKYTIADSNGNIHVVGFVFSDDLLGDFMSIIRQSPAKTNIVAATDAEVMVCDISVVRTMLDNKPDLRNKMTENLFCQAYELFLEQHVKSPKDRYVALLKRCPDILQNISLKEMASYLNITPTHLSRIRRELTFTFSKK